nr:hypothetical protein [Tanacetum cinerariifolium]
MVAILEKTKHNTDFHQIVDFLEAFHIRYALTICPTVYVSYIQQFWSTARVKTTDGETKILAQSKVPLRGADETAFLTRDVRYGKAFPTDTSLDAGEDLLDRDKSADKGSDNTDEMSHVLGSLGAANILASGGLRLVFTTASLSVATASTDISPVVATASGSFPTAVIFTTASVATPTTRVTRSSRGVVIGSLSPISVNIPSISKKDKGKEKMTEPEQPSKEKRDSDIARIYAEKELEMMIAELDRSNEMVAKYLSEYKQAEVGLSHDEKVELLNELLLYQRHLAQIKNNPGWKAKDFKGMTFEQIEEKFIPVWGKMQDFVPMNFKLESEKRSGIQLDKERIKKLKTTEASGTEPTKKQQSEEPKELSEEELKKMMEEDLDKLWSLVKETYSTTEVTNEKANELWVELKRLYEPDYRDPLWALQRLSVPTADVYIAKKLATVEDFALLHEDKIYLESKKRVCYN